MWKEIYEIGDETLDSQHKALYGVLNTLSEFVSGDSNWDEKFIKCKRTIESIWPLALEHFKAEEDYMESINYGGLTAHKQLHRQFLSSLRDFQYDFKMYKSNEQTVKELIKFLDGWLADHIQGEDQKFIKKKRLVRGGTDCNASKAEDPYELWVNMA